MTAIVDGAVTIGTVDDRRGARRCGAGRVGSIAPLTHCVTGFANSLVVSR